MNRFEEYVLGFKKDQQCVILQACSGRVICMWKRRKKQIGTSAGMVASSIVREVIQEFLDSDVA